MVRSRLGWIVALALVTGGCTTILIDETYKKDAGGAPGGGADSGVPCTMCGVECVDTTSDPAHCGQCFFPCDAVGSTCRAGACTCPEGRVLCGDWCAPVGECELECDPGLMRCSSGCVDVQVDGSHCGGCQRACDADELCSEGACVDASESDSCGPTRVIPTDGGTATFRWMSDTPNYLRTPFMCGPLDPRPSYVFSWTPGRSGSATITTSGVEQEVDTVLAVYEGACFPGTELVCNDEADEGGGPGSLVSLHVESGATYYIVIASYESTVQDYPVSVSVYLDTP